MEQAGDFVIKVKVTGETYLHRVSSDTLAEEVLLAGLKLGTSISGSRVAVEGFCLLTFVSSGEKDVARAREWRLRLDDGTYVPNDMKLGMFAEKGQSMYLSKREALEMVVPDDPSVDWIRLNVGGTHLVTSRTTLCQDSDSMLAKMFGAKWPASRTDETGAFMLDLDVRYFAPILNYLRWGTLALDPGVSEQGVRETAKFLQVTGVLKSLDAQHEEQLAEPTRKYHNVMMLACRFASWIGLSGAVPLSVPQKFKVCLFSLFLWVSSHARGLQFSATRKYGNQWELFSHSNELVALILNHLISMGWWVISSSAGGAGGDISVYQSYLLASDNADVVDLAINSDLFVFASGMRSPTHGQSASGAAAGSGVQQFSARAQNRE